LFASRGDSEPYIGQYLLFRDDKEKDRPDKPYMQGRAEFSNDSHGLTIYKDWWDGDNVSASYKGHVFFLGTIVNIVGETHLSSGVTARPEIWWCGLQVRRQRNTGLVDMLYGYVSDIGPKVGLFTDRIVLVRVTKQEWKRVKSEGEYYVTRDRVSAVATEMMVNYLDEWKNNSVRLRA
jgi:hypothetical protein